MSYSYTEITDIIASQKTFLKKKYGLTKIGIFSCREEKSGLYEVDFIVSFENPLGMMFIDFCEFIESLLNVKAEVLTEEGLENLKDDALKNGIKNKIKYI